MRPVPAPGGSKRLRRVWWPGIIVGAVVWCGGGAAGQEPADLTPASTMQAHQGVEQWVRQGEVTDAPARQAHVPGLLGVRVTLRYRGHLMGAGEAYRRGIGEDDRPVELYGLLRTATEEALRGVRRRLDDINSAARAADRLEDLPDGSKTLADVAPSLLVDVQIAGGLEPVRLAADAPAAAVFGGFVPGYHGLRVATPARPGLPGGVLWPGSAIAGNIPADRQVAGALASAGYPVTAAREAGRPLGPPLQRFTIDQVVRPAERLAPVHLVRGNVLLPLANISDGDVTRLARDLAEHLAQRLIGAQLVRGTYEPSTGQWDPELADPEDAALALLALARRIVVVAEVGGAAPLRLQEKLADTTLARVRAAVEDPQLQLATGSLLLLAMLEQPDLAGRDDLRAALVDRLLELRREPELYRRASDDDRPASDAAHAVLAAALAAEFDRTRDPAVGQPLVAVMEHLHERLVQAPSLSTFYWLARARRQAADRLPGQAELWDAYARTFAQLIDQLSQRQIVEPPAVGPADVVGGFDLGQRGPGAAPQPAWHSAHAMALLAVALRDPAIHRDADQLGWMLSAGLAGRFLQQLALTPAEAYYVRDPRLATGGLRLSLIDNRLATAPTALGSLAMTEFEATLHWLQAQLDPEAPGRAENRQPAGEPQP